MRDELSEVARRRRRIVADIERAICAATALLALADVWLFLRALEVCGW